jgi:hypothetical protein
MRVEFVFLPGNHDCNFRNEGDARPALIESVGTKIDMLDPGGDFIRRVIKVQDEFFAFDAAFRGSEEIPQPNRLRYENKVRFGEFEVLFDCYNTAWMSRKDEKQGSLFFPPRLLTTDAGDQSCHLRIALMHHRDNWLEANNARLLRDHLDTCADVILSGHEHVSAAYTKARQDGARAYYLEGCVLQDSQSPGNSGFNVIEFDLAREAQRTLQFRWSGQRYHQETDTGWLKLERNAAAERALFRIAPTFLKILRDPGTGFVHPAKPAGLSLDDLFVYPDLQRRSFKKLVKSNSSATVVSGQDVVRFVVKSKRVMISGLDDCGKTSLAHTLYQDLRQMEGLVPVLLSGSNLHGTNLEATLQREVRRAVSAQYSDSAIEPFEQLDASKKALIVDDWHLMKYNSKSQIALLSRVEKAFAYVICFADDIFALEVLTGAEGKPFRDYELCEIREFGHLLRNELIRKWIFLGAEHSEPDEGLAHSVTVLESTVNTLIGKNLLPAYPVIIIAILQSYVAARAPNSTAGSYGQMYEALITAALASVSKKAVDLGTKYTYISHIAHYILRSGRHELGPEDLQKIHELHREQFQVSLNKQELIEQLLTAQILGRTNGAVRFKYKYAYCYFVAKYFQENIANREDEGDLQGKLRELADHVYFEDYANIIIFYVYLTKDRKFIEYLLANANRIYSSHEPCDLASHVEFINTLGSDSRDLILPVADIEKNREDALRRKDEVEQQSQPLEEDNPHTIKYDDSLCDPIKVHIALKNLRILGQILRNFPGALRGDLKLQLALTTYQLGLRTLRAMFLIAESNLDDLRVYVSRLIQEKRAYQDSKELADETDSVLISLTRNLAFGMMKRISYSVGLEELEETYRSVLEKSGGPLPVKAIDYTIKLDHFAKFPKRELQELVDETHKNPFAMRLIRDLTADYLYLFPAEYKVRQYVGDVLGIKVNTAATLGPTSKKMKSLKA